MIAKHKLNNSLCLFFHLWFSVHYIIFYSLTFCSFFSNASLLMDFVILVYHIFSCISFIYLSFDNYNSLLISYLLHFTTQFFKALLFHTSLNDFICFEVYNRLLIFIMELNLNLRLSCNSGSPIFFTGNAQKKDGQSNKSIFIFMSRNISVYILLTFLKMVSFLHLFKKNLGFVWIVILSAQNFTKLDFIKEKYEIIQMYDKHLGNKITPG